jgi:hypothetical protein
MDWKLTSLCRKFFSSVLNLLKLNVEWVVLVVFNPEKEFHNQNLVGCHTLTITIQIITAEKISSLLQAVSSLMFQEHRNRKVYSTTTDTAKHTPRISLAFYYI